MADIVRQSEVSQAQGFERRVKSPIVRVGGGDVNELQTMIFAVADNQSVAINAHSARLMELTGAPFTV
jgi:hypothetical protein